jgi:hypothetical protein
MMVNLHRQGIPFDRGGKFRVAKDSDADVLISSSTRVFDGAEPVIVYQTISHDEIGALLSAFRATKFSSSTRTGGLLTHSRVFGFQPRVTVRRDYCCITSLAAEAPKENGVFFDYARQASRLFEDALPYKFLAHKQLVDSAVRPVWRIPDSVYTSGIVNKDNALHYHTDSGNFPGSWNAMYALSRDCAGGNLVLPEYRLAFSFSEPAYIVFPAQEIVHGVTPLHTRSASSYRYSIVFYALAGMRHCLPPEEELQRIRAVKTTRELKRAGLVKT